MVLTAKMAAILKSRKMIGLTPRYRLKVVYGTPPNPEKCLTVPRPLGTEDIRWADD